MEENDKVIYITSIIKIKKEFVKFLNDYDEVKNIIESNLSEVCNNYGLTHVFLGGKPFFLSGKDADNRDSFIPGQSEFYSMNQIAESLLASTKKQTKDRFYSLIKSEHLPRNSFDKPDTEQEYYYVTYPIIAIISDDAKPIMKNNFDLSLKNDIQTSITNMFKEILDNSIDVKSLIMTPYSILAQETIFKVIQSEDTKVNGITRISLSQVISISNPEKNKRANQPINLIYKDGNRVILPCHTYENLTSIIAVIENQLELPMLLDENKEFYMRLWLNNYINIVIAKRTLESIGYDSCFARADFKYTIEGDISRLYNDIEKYENIEKELDISSSFAYNVIKFDTGDSSQENISNNCKEMMIYIQKGRNNSMFEDSKKEMMTTCIMVSYLGNKDTIIASESFYGDINEKTKNLIMEKLEKKAEDTGVEINEVDGFVHFRLEKKATDKGTEVSEVNDIDNFSYDNIFNTLLATKQSEDI